jgi:hypothetical protein
MENTINYCCTSSFIFCNFRFWKIGNIPVLDWYIYLQLNLVLTPVSTNLLTRLLWFEAIPASWVYTMYWPYTNFNTGFIPASCHAKISHWPCIRIMLVWKFFKRTQYPWSSYMKILNIPNTRMELVCSDSVPDQYCNIQVPSRSIVECSSFCNGFPLTSCMHQILCEVFTTWWPKRSSVTHTKDFLYGKNASKLPNFENCSSEIAIFRQ